MNPQWQTITLTLITFQSDSQPLRVHASWVHHKESPLERNQGQSDSLPLRGHASWEHHKELLLVRNRGESDSLIQTQNRIQYRVNQCILDNQEMYNQNRVN